jgi:hypothetical protein
MDLESWRMRCGFGFEKAKGFDVTKGVLRSTRNHANKIWGTCCMSESVHKSEQGFSRWRENASNATPALVF